MPNRILKESIRTSKSVNGLTDFQFRLWAYLITYVDDFGRGSADPTILKGFVFPRRKGVTEANIADALNSLACGGLIQLYEVDGESYLCFPNWGKHQTVRAARSKFPAPKDDCKQLQADASNCMQMQADASNCLQVHADVHVIENRESIFDNRESLLENRESGSGNEIDARAAIGTVEAYASGNLECLTPSHMAALADFKRDLPDDVIRYAIDQACGNGAPRWSYVAAILQGFVESGVKTLGDAKARSARHKKQAQKQRNPALNYEQRGDGVERVPMVWED